MDWKLCGEKGAGGAGRSFHWFSPNASDLENFHRHRPFVSPQEDPPTPSRGR